MQSQEVLPLFNKLLTLLYSKSWDTRVASAAAIGAILDNITPWDPEPIPQCNTAVESVDTDTGAATVATVLQRGHQLHADAETELQDKSDSSDAASVPRLDHQRQLLNQKLGLDVAASLGLDTSNIFTNDDLMPVVSSTTNAQKTNIINIVPEIPSQTVEGNGLGREKRASEDGQQNVPRKRHCAALTNDTKDNHPLSVEESSNDTPNITTVSLHIHFKP